MFKLFAFGAVLLYLIPFWVHGACPVENDSNLACVLGNVSYARMCSCQDNKAKTCNAKKCDKCLLQGSSCDVKGTKCCPRWDNVQLNKKPPRFQAVNSLCQKTCKPCADYGKPCNEVDIGKTGLCCAPLVCLCRRDKDTNERRYKCGIQGTKE